MIFLPLHTKRSNCLRCVRRVLLSRPPRLFIPAVLVVVQLQTAGSAREVCEDPGEVRDAGGFKGDARVVRRQTNHCLHELHRVNAGNDLGSELGDYHHDDACQEAGLQKQGLDDLRDVEQEFSVVAVDRCQLGGKEDQTHDKDLATQKKPFNVVSLGGYLSKPIGLWVTFPVRRRILTFELYQGDLNAFHHPQEEEHNQEYDEGGPSWYSRM